MTLVTLAVRVYQLN